MDEVAWGHGYAPSVKLRPVRCPQLPVITDLRNPTLKQRHWDVIEEVLDFHFTEEEPLTLGLLQKIHAFRHSERLQEISGQASSEASLEAILKKVRRDV